MDPTRISTQVNVKHCSLCQGDTEYYCYGCRQDLCIQCKKLHVIDLSTKNHEVTRYIERMKYPPKDESEESGGPDSRDSNKQVKSARSGKSEQVMCVRSRDPVTRPVWLSPSERSEIHEIERRQYSERISYLRGEIIYNRLVMLKGVRQDLKTGHKAATIRGLSMAGMIGQVTKDKIDEVLAGDLEDRCIIQKTRMTRHMTRLLQYVHRYEQLNDIMVKQPIKFLRIIKRKRDSPKIQEILQTHKDQEKLFTQRGKKEMVNMVVNLMKGMRSEESRKRQASGTELLLTLMSSPVLQKSLSVTGVSMCSHISCVTPDRVWVSDGGNIILTDTATGPPSGSRLEPCGICTDVMSHILVSDLNTATVQMLDRDGQFLSYLLTTQSPGIDYRPLGLSYDVTNHVLCVGSGHNTLSVYRYINRHLALSDTREHGDVSLSSEPFNSRHIPGLTQEEFDRQEEERRRHEKERRRRLGEERRRQQEERRRRQGERRIRRREEEEERQACYSKLNSLSPIGELHEALTPN
uniref:Uncharacterized protein LOC111132791 n=1 Tax=Crassostrea virginica TaxID=6565 RepID=A0A8B8E6S3_CRAVI|nr:uncharacterized protein LOC111132791 [Crassostrea virginica]